MTISIELLWSNLPLPINKIIEDPDVVVSLPVGGTIITNAGAVSSVNGKTGVVTLNASDVGATTQAYVDAQDAQVLSTVGLQLANKADLVNGVIPASQLPSYVDDVLDFASINDFPAIGDAGKIYIDDSTNKTYRWGGSSYVEISDGGVALGETASTAYRGDRGKIAYDHSQTQGNPHNTIASEIILNNVSFANTSKIANGDNLSVAAGKLQGQIDAAGSNFNWVDITTVGAINPAYIAYTSANFPNDTCKIEVARKDGMLWICGDFYVTTSITATPTKIFEITDSNYKILHKIDSGATYQLVSPTARSITQTSSIFTYIPSRVDSIANISTVLEFRAASIGASNTSPVHIPVTCVGKLVV